MAAPDVPGLALSQVSGVGEDSVEATAPSPPLDDGGAFASSENYLSPQRRRQRKQLKKPFHDLPYLDTDSLRQFIEDLDLEDFNSLNEPMVMLPP